MKINLSDQYHTFPAFPGLLLIYAKAVYDIRNQLFVFSNYRMQQREDTHTPATQPASGAKYIHDFQSRLQSDNYPNKTLYTYFHH